MKKILIFTWISVFSLAFPAFAQQMINAGSDIYISQGTKMVVNSDYKNMNDGQITNNGNIDVYGNWTNDGTTQGIAAGGSGITTFKGNHQPVISGSSDSYFNSLFIDIINDSSLNLAANVNLEDQLNIVSGRIRLNDYNLNLGTTGQDISTGYGHFIVTNGMGKLQMNVPAGTYRTFRVGAMTWNYCYIRNNSGTDNIFSVNIFNDILDGGTTGNTIPEIDDCVPFTWNVSPSNLATANYKLGCEWDEFQEGSSFNRFQSAVGYYKNSQWNGNVESYAIGGDPHTQEMDSITFGGSFAVGDVESPMAIVLEMNIDLTAFLEGPFNGSDMNTGLNSASLLPLSQPFNTAPWNYEGTESVTSIPANVVDWVLIEGRDSPTAFQATGTQTFGRQAAFLLSDGSIVGMDGVSPISFQHYHLMYELFVIVHHRNHLSILSSNYLTETNGVYTYDFTTSTAQAYQSGEKDVNGVAVIYGGDANADGVINTDDGTIWQGEAGTTGYLKSDITLDGQSDNKDKNDVWISNIGAESKVPQ